MATPKQTKQTRILYICFIALLITAAIAAAVAGGMKKSAPEKTPVTPTESQREPKQTDRETEAGIFPPFGNDGKTETETEKERESESLAGSGDGSTEPVAVEPEPITFVVPVNGLLYAPFSDTAPVFSPTMNDYRTHSGVDVEAAEGDPVFACADGVISEIWDDPMMGKTVRITHADGFESVYRNLAEEVPDGIARGVEVRAGQTIGAVGTTALLECEDEPHLHFELRLAGKNVDPADRIVFRLADNEYED